MARKELTGEVVSDKMQKTVVVAVKNPYHQPVYRKLVRRITRFKAHDEFGAKIGDVVKIVETRPLSKEKRWKVVEIISPSSS